MIKISQRVKKICKKVDKKTYNAVEALSLLKETATAKFVETAEVHIKLHLDTKHVEQQLRTIMILPKGTGKRVKIGVIIQEDKVAECLSAGADLAGSDSLIKDISKGIITFDKLITTPDMMPIVAKLGKILGPRGLMPSPKSGTVTFDIKKTIEEFKKGKVEYRADKNGIVHVPFGKTSFSIEELLINLGAIQESIDKNKPLGVKGHYWESFYICSTMGPSIPININNFRNKIFA